MDTRQTERPRRSRRPADERRSPATPRRAPKRQSPAKTPQPAKPARKPDIEKEIIYTPGKPFNRNRLFLQIGIVVAVVVALFFSMSLFFKVDTIEVAGNRTYSIATIVKASGIKTGDSLLSISDANVSGQIITELPYVKLARVGIKLPGTVIIEIEELDVVYSVCDTTGQWWLVTSEGRVVEMTDSVGAADRTKILGVTITDAAPGKQAVAFEAQPSTLPPEDASLPAVTQPVTVSSRDRLMVALSVLQNLEQNDIIGQMVSVDVSDMGRIILLYGEQFRIVLGDSSDLSYKIRLAVAAIGQLKEHDRGELDISFVDRPEVVYTPQID